MDHEHVVGDSDRGGRKRQRNTTSKQRKKKQLVIFSVSQKRVLTIAKQMKTGTGISETRRGDTKSRNYVDKKRKIKKSIAARKGKESHYGRVKLRQIYLSFEMNITTLHELYNDSVTKEHTLSAVFPPDINNHEDTNSQTEEDDEDVREYVCDCNEDDGGIKI
ncbi:hypothetical protein ILUMI_24822 [Ignelater luminosus]|uniref:Uncharacterized protein n=1 Tax=Ignelater luminosus TaxID=2038154 RepID=A0A8K0G0I8_IGNLU|nr:hypothetical protein ILUMI_24822 [Ignelater luminosus]